jgi:hypothetical protein
MCLVTESHANSARQGGRYPFTRAFLLITALLPAKSMITKGLAPHISSTQVWERVGVETSYLYIHEASARPKC